MILSTVTDHGSDVFQFNENDILLNNISTLIQILVYYISCAYKNIFLHKEWKYYL